MMWAFGDTITRREVMGLSPIGDGDIEASWHDKAWIEQQVRVIEHSEDRLSIYVEPNSPHTFPPGEWPGGIEHPWKSRGRWEGSGCLMTQDPSEHHAVWHFWAGADRGFVCWYINLQTAPRLYGKNGYRATDKLPFSDLYVGGWPTVSYKGGPVGVVQVINESTLVVPICDSRSCRGRAG